MRTYLIDGTNVVRGGAYDPRFPDVEEARTAKLLGRLSALAAPYLESIRVEVFFDGPRRPVVSVDPPVHVRFPIDGHADTAILGTARRVLSSGRGVVVVTGDGALADEVLEEGGRVMGLGELERRLRERKA
ncbi:MAG: NYN domain-containing protein [Elusimicrobiota bacterium]